MSSDASYIIRDGDQQQYFYSRWGALHLDVDLLQGPESFQRHIGGLEQLNQPFLERYINSLAEVDLEERRLRYWGSQGFGFDAVSQRMYRALLQAQWPGWTLEWLFQPADVMNVDVPRIHTPQFGVSEVQAWQSAQWNELKGQCNDLIEEQGEAATRTDFEALFDGFNTWITVRSKEGLRDEIVCNYYDLGHAELFLLGPDLVDVLDARSPRSFDELKLSECQLKACCVIDLVDQCFSWWVRKSPWYPFFNMQEAWPGWEVRMLTEGPIGQLAMTGRVPSALLRSHCLTNLDEWFTSLLGPRRSPLAMLTKVAANIVQQSGSTVEITLPGAGSEGIPPTPAWADAVKHHYDALLNTPAFQLHKDVQ